MKEERKEEEKDKRKWDDRDKASSRRMGDIEQRERSGKV